MVRPIASIVILCWVGALGCAPRTSGSVDSASRDGGLDGSRPVYCAPGASAVQCSGADEVVCNADGTIASRRTCTNDGLMCAPGKGCVTCIAGARSCNGDTPRVCRADSSGYDLEAACDLSAGLSCRPGTGACTNLCQEAAASKSYIGCEYWPVVTMNSSLAEEFEFAAIVANPQSVDATVTITRGGTTVAGPTIVAADSVATFRLPWVAELKQRSEQERSALVQGGAFHLTSNVPVTVYQFNPLDYQLQNDCDVEPPGGWGDGKCFSYTNDASLLLPSHVLTGNYTVLTRPSQMLRQSVMRSSMISTSPGFVSITAVDRAMTTVDITFTSHVIASTDGAVRALAPGETGQFTLAQGDVLQLASSAPESCSVGSSDSAGFRSIDYCTVGREYDLTGTQIRSTNKLAVVAGNNCTFVPYNRWACDHLEEVMFPEETWGKSFVVSATQPLRSEPNVIRILSGSDGNALTFEPAITPNVTLNEGQIIEFEASSDFRVTGTGALLVGQFLVGQDYAGIATSEEGGQGDPSMSLAIPSEQFRLDYSFLAPETYDISFVSVTAPTGQSVRIDSATIDPSAWRAVGSTGMSTARVPISGGIHHIEADRPFGIVVYGFGSYTSYMFPGGLDLQEINAPG